MKTLIVYDSLFGNTKEIALAIKKGIGNEAKILKADEFKKEDLLDVKLLIVGSPTHAGRPSEKIKVFLERIEIKKGIMGAAFDTGIPTKGKNIFLKIIIKFFKYASPHIAKALEKKGVKVMGTKTLFVLDKKGPLEKGEKERAEKWAKEVFEKTKQSL